MDDEKVQVVEGGVSGTVSAEVAQSQRSESGEGKQEVEKTTHPFDEKTKVTAQRIPVLRTRAGPGDGQWAERLKEEYQALIQYVRMNKANDENWFVLKANQSGTKWEGSCWYFLDSIKYEFDLCFDIPIGYPLTPPELKLPELDGKTVKMYHGGKICLTVHFQPLWARNAPRFGIAHALALGLAPWLASEVPDLVRRGVILPK